ncbi:MAG: 50S ribosomal protein L10 [Chloroflexi bacterium]|nr:50S ribosomal protein L10 [Chloroflexota bacterium]
MPTEKKIQQVDQIADLLSRCTIAIATDYRGLSMTEMMSLRRKLRAQGVEYRVVKNSLARLAAEKTESQPLIPLLEGPTALAFGYGEITEPAKVLVDHIRSERSVLSIKGGLMGGEALAPEQVNILATLPSREVLLAKALGALQGPIYSLHAVLSAQLRGLITALNARLEQLQGE